MELTLKGLGLNIVHNDRYQDLMYLSIDRFESLFSKQIWLKKLFSFTAPISGSASRTRGKISKQSRSKRTIIWSTCIKLTCFNWKAFQLESMVFALREHFRSTLNRWWCSSLEWPNWGLWDFFDLFFVKFCIFFFTDEHRIVACGFSFRNPSTSNRFTWKWIEFRLIINFKIVPLM